MLLLYEVILLSYLMPFFFPTFRLHFCEGKIIYTLNSVVSYRDNQSARDIMDFCSVIMDAWYYRINAACDTME